MHSDLRFDGSRAYAHLKHLVVDIGPRLGGSHNERRAAEYIRRYYESLGLKVRLEEFPVTNYDLQEKRLEVVSPALGDIPCEVYYLNQDTPPEGIVADAVYVGPGNLSHLGPEVEGRIVLVLRGVRSDTYADLMRWKPAGLVIIEDTVATGPIRTETLPEVRAKFGAVPAVRISHEDGLQLVKGGVERIRMVVQTVENQATSCNVIADLQGTVFPDQLVVIGGHFDSSIGIQGASDNAGGTVVAMELARVFAERGSKRSLRFFAWGSEELGLRGSVHHVKGLKKAHKDAKKADGFVKGRDKTELDTHVLCVNIDVQGAMLGMNEAMVLGPKDLAAAVRLMSKEHGPSFKVEETTYSSDNMPFSEAGVPSVGFARSGGTTSFLHTPGDVIDHLSPAALEENGRFVEEFLIRYATEARVFPFEREIPDDQKKKIKEYFEKLLRIDYLDDEENDKKKE
ncbi:M20/M25/M40 family metallo-hydrolase [Candidatus Fermentibacteria bacterium]|nr:M20/M25/M40 family metallo-hydrolase [Candidatus Fermentibacteria bacterium]